MRKGRDEEANSGIEGGDLLYQMLVWNLYRMPIVRPITVSALPKIPLLGLDPGVGIIPIDPHLPFQKLLYDFTSSHQTL